MTPVSQITVTQMKPGQRGAVTRIGEGRGMKRLEAMGLQLGTRIIKVSGMFGRGPVTIKIGRAKVAIGYGMASKILVEVKEP